MIKHITLYLHQQKPRVQSANLGKINNISITRVNNTKFLGVKLDSELKWKLHIEFVKNKISKCIGILTKAKKFLNKIV